MGFSNLRKFQRKQKLGLYVKAPYVASKPKFLMKSKGFSRKSGFYGRFRSGIKQEMKFLDTTIDTFIDATNEVISQLNIIPQGDGQSDRDGRKAIVKSVSLKGTLSFVPAAGATAATSVNMWLIQDTQCNGAAATVANDNTGIFTTVGADSSQALRCLANTDRYKIHKHWTWNLAPNAGVGAAYNNVLKQVSYYKTLDVPLEFDASAATGVIATIKSNNLFLVAGSTGSDDTCRLTATARIRFVG